MGASSRAVLVTGGAGYIGSHAAKALSRAGYRVVVFDNLVAGHREAVKYGELVEGDITDPAAVGAAIDRHGVAAVMHFAAYLDVGESVRELPGVGEWTAQYIAMRALSWPDAFPHTDAGVMKALGETGPSRVLAAGEAWRPWRSYAVMHLWQSLTKSA